MEIDVKSETILSGASFSFVSPPGSLVAHVTVTGAGSGTVQPVFRDSNSDHQAYTVADDTYRLEIPHTDSFDVTAVSDDIWAQVSWGR